MKKVIFIATFVFIFGFTLPTFSFAQGMTGFSSSDNSAIQSQQQEEQAGKNFLNELNDKIITCPQLQDADFEKIGEYFMGQAIGDTSRHIAMNEMVKSMMGERGEEQMHIAWGKHGSGCDTASQSTGFMPMMNMMRGWRSSSSGLNQSGNSMMNFGFGSFGGFGWVPMILWWVLIIFSIVALIKWFMARSRNDKKSPLGILKERYAKGEIDRKEFEEKKKDLLN